MIKRWRESLPARVATATTGLLALVLIIVTFAFYLNTALLVRQGLDRALAAALPLTAGNLGEVREHAERMGEDRPPDGRGGNKQLRVIDPDGSVRMGNPDLPVDAAAVAQAMRTGKAYTYFSGGPGNWYVRTGPEWWLAMTPRQEDMRVMYARWGRRDEAPMVLELIAPVGDAGEVLPALLWRILLLAVGGVAVCGVIIWRMAGETYRPLRAVIAIADSITMNTLSTRIPDQWGDRTLRRLGNVLNEMVGRLQEAFETQGRFVAAAAHELRGPLAAMRAQLEIRLRRERSPSEYKEALAVALTETIRLSALAEHLLILARFEHGAGMAVQQDVALRPLLDLAAEEAHRVTGAEVLVEAPDDLLLDADPVAVERVVSNLIRNGVNAGGAPIRVTAAAQGDQVRITVADQGRGIPPEALPNLFEPFWRGDPARGRESGTGLGLAIVKTAVEAHRGRVSVQSEPGKGSTFTVWLPRRQGPGPA